MLARGWPGSTGRAGARTGGYNRPAVRAARPREWTMRWEGQRQSEHVEDRRGAGRGGMARRGGGVGLVGVIIALLASWIFGINPMVTLGLMEGAGSLGGAPQQVEGRKGPVADEAGRFTSVVLASTEDVWKELFRQMGAQYRPPRLVMFSGRTPTACGTGQSASGPFYCPSDQTVYIDTTFYDDLQRKFQAPGDFAAAYVVAHEVGHHIQNLMGTMREVQGLQQRSGERQANALSVRLELQADCYAGVWAHHSQKARGWIDRGDVEEGLNAASQIGDDRMMRRSSGVVVPDAFTHGSGQQRVHWFSVGMRTGSLQACDTFRQTTP
jgi:predicted metalloprotease